MHSRRGSAPKIVALIVYIIVILVAAPQAQQPVSFSGSSGAITTPGPAAIAPDATAIDLLVGRSTLVNVGATIQRVSLTVPDVADALVTSPQQLLIHGKTPGVISLFVWDRTGGIKTYAVNVRRDLTQLIEQVQNLFPGEPITVTGSGKDVVLSGTVSTKYVVDKAAEVAGGFVEKKENVVNLLKQQEGVASNQVMLRVRFAEVSRSALQELGASFVANGYKSQWFGRTGTEQFPEPEWDQQGRLVFSDFLNLFVLNTRQGLGGVIRALQNKGLFQSLAEPNLIALNGKEASFLAGGEYPYPVVQPGSGTAAVTIMFKEFGVRLSFTPTVLANDLINLKVRPEVSSLDFSNAITLEGFRVPALSTRRTETEVELQNGQTFAIAGLMNNTMNSSMQKIPGIGDIPILGYLFRSRAYQKNQTELVVMITPTIVRRGSTGVSEGLPSIVEPYLGAPSRPLPQPAPYVGSPRYPTKGGSTSQNQQPQREQIAQQPEPKHPAEQKAVAPKPAPVQQMPAARPAPAPQNLTTTQMPQAQAPAPAMVVPSSAASKAQPRVSAEAQEKERREAEAAAKAKAEQERREADAVAKAKAEQDRKDAEAKKIADQKASEERARQQKLDEERAKREAMIAKKNAEADKQKQAEQKKKEKALAEAAERLREAQAAYEAEMAKLGAAKGDKGGSPIK